MQKQTKAVNRPWRYALAMFGLSIMGYMYSAYATFFYNDKLGLSLGAIGVANILFSLWDAFNDPIAGVLSDRTRTKWGRRKPWLLVAVPVFALGTILFFSPPAFLGKGLALTVYFTFFLMLTETANTIASVNYHSLLPELFRKTEDRNRANAIRQALQLVGMIIGVSLVPMIAASVGYSLTALLLGIFGCAMILYAILGCRERPDFSGLPQPKLLPSLKSVVSNRNFWLVSVSHFFYQATSGLLLAGIPFYIKFSLGLPDTDTTILTACVFISAIPAMVGWYWLIKKKGTLLAWRSALLWLGLSLIPMFFAQSLLVACITGVFMGIGIAGVTANLDMVNSELIEEDAARSGQRREATYFAAISFVTRLSGLVRSAVFFFMLLLFGFASGENPGDRPGMAVRYMMSAFPVVLMGASFLVACFVKFNTAKGDSL